MNFSQSKNVTMLIYVWLVGGIPLREQFKSVRMVCGWQYVPPAGITLQQKLSADNLDTVEVMLYQLYLFACIQAVFFTLYAGSYALREYSGSLQESTVMNRTVIHCYGHEMSLSECFLVKAYECIAKAVVLCTG